MPDTLRESYEAVPYESNTIPGTQIGSLEAVSMLHGLRPVPADRCRVLELGCASGGNIIPMAYRFSNSQFVGVDFADNQVREGIREIEQLGLSNVELRSMSIADIGEDFGIFDYIICHGVYSWVPPDVADAILRVSSRNLAPNGVVYISYNVYPGWHQRELLRDMMMFHDDASLTPVARIARTRAFVERVVATGRDTSSLYERILADEVSSLRLQGDAHLLHEQLESFNYPVYFSEFARRATQHGLQFLCESKLSRSGWQSEDAARKMAGDVALDTVRMEQYLDFVRGRTFRASVLCHDSHSVRRTPSPEAIPEMHFVGTSVPDTPSADDVAEGGHVAAFRSRQGTTASTHSPVVTATLRSLSRASPRSLSFPDVLSLVEQRLAADVVPGLPGSASDADELRKALPQLLLDGALGGFLDVDRHPTKIETRVSEQPRASLMARVRAASPSLIPTLAHGRVTLGAPERFLLARLDGSRTRERLLVELQAATADGEIDWGDRPPTNETAADAIDSILEFFVTCALMEA